MASSKEPSVSRPVSGGFARMSSSHRSHSNSLSLSATNTIHRVHRRKSVNASASSTAQAAIAAALRENGETTATSVPHRRSIGAKKHADSHSMSTRPNMHSYFGPGSTARSIEQDTFEDVSMDEEETQADQDFVKNRNRRASEGSHLLKGGSKKTELRCDTCGKGYKHSSCLTKHMWEHDPAWAVTSKLLISKHQQVQLLEAASVLCNMTVDGNVEVIEPDTVHIDPSETSSASPVYSGSSEVHDDASSVETTPPPMSEDDTPDLKRYSASSAGFSRSYRSAASSSYVESAFSPNLFPQRLSGVDFRPTTSGTDDGSLAAAAAGLTFSGTPRPTTSDDIPPVPPLPQQYQSYSRSARLDSMHNPFSLHPPSLTQQLSDERNYRSDKNEHDDRHNNNHLEEEGMFHMEQ